VGVVNVLETCGKQMAYPDQETCFVKWTTICKAFPAVTAQSSVASPPCMYCGKKPRRRQRS